ncbi:ATP-binding protein [Pseudofrankia inefficax]|uniref:Putative signal transduction histidine kinase n=1 Tax=Pseudofrankia inefficax (strain DSM 45817 / CECT 9037 / DDB 130130 / EuI1c) TaxID=298654 RepID=E3IVU7_PSEI1|nr:ATP-binding protein [Pseudofrankia inefficax]ADP83749.1 putative signal transduction histidine kinase [Pseudofrankia inefficax]
MSYGTAQAAYSVGDWMTARALDAFASVIFRGLAVLRALVVLYAVAYVAVWWHDWYGPHPWRLVGPALVLGWSIAWVAVAARRALPRWIVLADVAVGATIGLTAPWTVPDPSLGDPSSWVFFSVLLSGMGAVCALRTRWSLAVMLVLAAAHAVPAYDHRPPILTSTGLLLFICVALRQSIVLLVRVATQADAWLEAVGARARAEAVAAARARADRAHERFLHDTVLNMLAGIGLGGAGRACPPAAAPAVAAQPAPALEAVRSRCRRIVDQVESLLAGSGDAAAGPQADPDANLDGLVAGVVDEALDDGLTVAYRFVRVQRPRWRRPARGGTADCPKTLAEEPLPVDVAAALAAAVREALTNVRRHAGVAAARVTVVRWLDGVRVRIDDAGVGFDAARFDAAHVDPTPAEGAGPPAGGGGAGDDAGRARLGLRGSVHGRMVDVGGWARILSRPGIGTRVELHWQAAQPAVARSEHGADLRRDYEQAIRRGVGIAVLTGVAVLSLPAIGYRGHARLPAGPLHPIAPVASLLLWAVVAAGALSTVVIIRRRPLDGREALVVLAFVALVILTGATLAPGDEVIRIYDWAGTVAPTVLLLPITVSRPTRQWALAVAVIVGVELAVGLMRLGSQPLDVVRLLGLLYGVSTIQLLVTVAGPVLRATAETTTAAAAMDAELGASQDAAAAIRRDRARRLARLNRDVLPLLRSVGAGGADPREETVRRLCASRARALRRMLSGGGGPAGPLTELETAIDAAEARGAMVVLQVAGELAAVATDVREELVDLLSETLRVAPPGRVTVTLLCDGGEGFISYPAAPGVVAEAGPEPRLAALSALVTRTELDEDNTVVELRWPVSATAA